MLYYLNKYIQQNEFKRITYELLNVKAKHRGTRQYAI